MDRAFELMTIISQTHDKLQRAKDELSAIQENCKCPNQIIVGLASDKKVLVCPDCCKMVAN